ncbi:hypothetical protein [Lacticaseibacillus daqingensis]|uniref:hypothetical protein n=1 Tax=Lacticaseibacillus daqingensis TaxID=2486014 RepID=UPI000F7A2723|nr:hypothetical protein [Lacticaseibacillus daqingensis]
MADQSLLLPDWQTLSAKQRDFAATQLSRYFLSPLVAVDARVPVTVSWFGQTLATYDFLIAGEWLRFVPGMRQVSLGVPNPLPPAMHPVVDALGVGAAAVVAHLSPAAVVDLPPMLVARASIASDLEVLGQIDLLTQRFLGNHFAFSPVRQAVLTLLQPSATEAPAALAPVLTDGQVVLRQVGESTYQVAQRRDWDLPQLLRRLGGFGFGLATEREFEYLMSGGGTSLFAWGNRLPTQPMNYVPNRFGLTVPVVGQPELLATAVAKRAGLTAPPTGAAWLGLSPFYRAAAPTFAGSRYRKIVRIAL